MDIQDWLRNDILYSFHCSLQMLELRPAEQISLRANGPNCYGWSIYCATFDCDLFYYVKMNKCVIEFSRGNQTLSKTDYVEPEEAGNQLHSHLAVVLGQV